jgi:hypothetical protein
MVEYELVLAKAICAVASRRASQKLFCQRS